MSATRIEAMIIKEILVIFSVLIILYSALAFSGSYEPNVIAEEFVVSETQDNSLKVSVSVTNLDGEIVSPFIRVDILDNEKSETLKTFHSNKIKVLPNDSAVVEIDVHNNFYIGTYWADITLLSKEGLVLGKSLFKFTVVDKGNLHIGEPAKFEVLSLSMNQITLLFGLVVALFAAYMFSRRKKELLPISKTKEKPHKKIRK